VSRGGVIGPNAVPKAASFQKHDYTRGAAENRPVAFQLDLRVGQRGGSGGGGRVGGRFPTHDSPARRHGILNESPTRKKGVGRKGAEGSAALVKAHKSNRPPVKNWDRPGSDNQGGELTGGREGEEQSPCQTQDAPGGSGPGSQKFQWNSRRKPSSEIKGTRSSRPDANHGVLWPNQRLRHHSDFHPSENVPTQLTQVKEKGELKTRHGDLGLRSC